MDLLNALGALSAASVLAVTAPAWAEICVQYELNEGGGSNCNKWTCRFDTVCEDLDGCTAADMEGELSHYKDRLDNFAFFSVGAPGAPGHVVWEGQLIYGDQSTFSFLSDVQRYSVARNTRPPYRVRAERPGALSMAADGSARLTSHDPTKPSVPNWAGSCEKIW